LGWGLLRALLLAYHQALSDGLGKLRVVDLDAAHSTSLATVFSTLAAVEDL